MRMGLFKYLPDNISTMSISGKTAKQTNKSQRNKNNYETSEFTA